MAEEPNTPPETAVETPAETEETVPASRFAEMAKHKKAADQKAKELERQMADLRSQLEERETAGLPELDRMKKDLERAQKRAEEAEQRAQEHENQMALAQRERWVTAAASKLNFVDPDDAARYVNLADIEDSKDAERAVKRVAGEKKHLLKPDEPNLPGQVLENGRTPQPGTVNGVQVAGMAQPGSAMGLISTDAEAAAVGEALRAFRESRKPTQITFGA